MPSTAATRVDEDLFESAKHASAFTGRSAAQQLAHWARVGREVEASSAISVRELEGRLAGAQSYDDLEPDDQARVRAEWAEGIAARLRKVDFTAAFRKLGVPWIGVDADGKVVRRVPRGYDAARVADDTRAALGIREPASADVLAALARAEARLAREQADEPSGRRSDERGRKAQKTEKQKTEKPKAGKHQVRADRKPAKKKLASPQASARSRATQ